MHIDNIISHIIYCIGTLSSGLSTFAATAMDYNELFKSFQSLYVNYDTLYAYINI